jgi:hypothetical protein
VFVMVSLVCFLYLEPISYFLPLFHCSLPSLFYQCLPLKLESAQHSHRSSLGYEGPGAETAVKGLALAALLHGEQLL